MAALNTLRTKGAFIMTGAIAFALLAFLLSDGDFLNSNQNIEVGKINGKNVSMIEFNEKVDDLEFFNQFVSGKQSLNNEESEQMNNTAWQRIVIESLFGSSNEELGLAVSDEEMIDMANGVYISPVLKSLFGNEIGQLNRELMVSIVSNISEDETGNTARFWNQTEAQMAEERLMSKYMSLVKNGLYTTDFEVEVGVNDLSKSFDIKYLTNPTNEVEGINITDADIKNYYETNISKYKANRFREIEYVVYETVPSEMDYSEAKEYFAELTAEFETTKELEQFINLNSEEKFDTKYYSIKNINPEFKSFAFDGKNPKMYQPKLNGNIYSAARIASSRMMPDSITFRAVAVDPTKNVDSLVRVIKASKGGFDNVVKTSSLSPDGAGTEKVTLNTSDVFYAQLLGPKVGEVIVLDLPAAKTIVKVLDVDKLVRKVQIANLIYNVMPSNKSEQDNYALANAFADKVAVENVDFSNVVSENALVKRIANLTADIRVVNGIENTKEIVRWAFNNEEKSVSSVITSGSSNYIVYLKKSFEGEYTPLDDVKEDIKKELTRQQTVNACMKDLMAFKSLDEAAKALNTKVKTASDISFASSFVMGLGLAYDMIGAITVTPKGVLSSPISTGTHAALFEVTEIKDNKKVSNAIERNTIDNNNKMNIETRVFSSILDGVEVYDNRIIYM